MTLLSIDFVYLFYTNILSVLFFVGLSAIGCSSKRDTPSDAAHHGSAPAVTASVPTITPTTQTTQTTDSHKKTVEAANNNHHKPPSTSGEPNQAYEVDSTPEQNPQPRQLPLSQKAQFIAQTGAIRRHTDYPTLDDIVSDWDDEPKKDAAKPTITNSSRPTEESPAPPPQIPVKAN